MGLDVQQAFQRSERVWLNTAHQGALPLGAAHSAEQALAWKLQPHRLQEQEPFSDVPDDLRRALAMLLNANQDDVVLANSASYGLHLLANGLPWSDGDEVVVAANDFPSDVLPWLALRDRGVKVVMIEPAHEVLDAAELSQHLTRRTKLICLTWVHSFSGRTIDVERIGEAAQANGSMFVLNASQGLGALPLNVRDLPVDALVSVGFKWLCGPYGTGVCWFRPHVRDVLAHLKMYWLTALTTHDLASERLDLRNVQPPERGRLDIFGTANFLNFMPFAESVGFLLSCGIPEIARHNQSLVARLLAGFDRHRFRLISTEDKPARSTLVVIEPTGEDASDVFRRLQERGVDVAHRAGRIRLSPHLYNDEDDIDVALAAL